MKRLNWFTTPSGKIVQVLETDDRPTAQGCGAALVKGDFDANPWWIEACLLSPPCGFDSYPYALDSRFNAATDAARSTEKDTMSNDCDGNKWSVRLV